MRPRAGGGGATCFLLHGEEVWILLQEVTSHVSAAAPLTPGSSADTFRHILKTHHSQFCVTFGAGCGKFLEESVKD